ncbi:MULTISPECIES: CaiB/BaiF CoA transferase family protein [unclassified Streptomyces]|uniref:CaiB/BaiF CoA transferase family protein n=1 Tax=unclassified Streptomyces TaxID=2593676 RepID=UPI00081B89DE|nr:MULTISPECIES: CaiB/BaiF CoA-transferase family protein [unclassified Streptomyces]MYQ84561.1 CoA transferase [Streptomyces sp. SID4936]SCD88372.1 Crotonobetainyl-CoA:carnitine CoA-transferase CaiB [Streptomyces sp. DvalAA-43]
MTTPAHPAAPAWSSLTGRRILDLSRLLPGPYATSLLADLGADVIKVESPGAGDPLRIAPELFEALNRNKRSITLDLRDEDGRNTFLDLVRTADAVVESFRPGVLDGMGLGLAALHEANPRLVLCSLSGYGQSGPYAQKPGHELNFLGLSGFFAVPGRLDGEITRPGVRIGDMAGAMHAALALAAALGAGTDTGGQHIDVSLSESITAWCSLFALPLRDLPDPLEAGLVQGDNDVFTTADGRRLSLATFEDKFWYRFRTGLAADFPALDTPDYDRRAVRTAARQTVSDLLRGVFRARDHAWWQERLDGLGAPWAPVLTTPAELLADPHTTARRLFDTPADPAACPQARFPVTFGARLDTFRTPAPALGEHTREVLGAERSGPVRLQRWD